MLRGRTQLCSLVLAAVMIARPDFASAQQSNGKSIPAPTALAVLKTGQSKELHLCWDEGTGRAPVFFFDNEANLAFRKKNDLKGEAKYEQDGVSAEYDEKQSATVQADLYKTGLFTGPQEDGSYQRVTCAVIRLRATKDARLGAHSVFVHIVSGTGRHMLLSGEFRVLVRE
ncbi:hypothetical protein Poly51_62850 [Rubripirellula tenax]|uniref:Uncharacterized protein n=1 Tax=Rubripirellula tenax TaxID=2528015 RepID=A0A5C6E489_9BACT|nr:hypothetical protein [Rubripirellula tenax]TWU43630.1 hypothetical protein Poly51_62850 [Rubripirellula tenax]